jgi:hypothetical protein
MSAKVALLVLGARYPLGLRALSTVFDRPDVRIFAHIDAKVDQTPFEAAAAAAVTFVEPRETVYWGGWTMVEATLRLIRAAHAAGPFDAYVLLSDDSVPLLPASSLLEQLLQQPDRLQRYVTPDRAWRYEQFFMLDSAATQLRPSDDRSISDDALSRLARLAALKVRGKKPLSEHHQGPQWWSLSARRVERILDAWLVDPWLRESFEFSWVPDEGYIQTLLARDCPANPPPLMWADWSGPVRPRLYQRAEELIAAPVTPALFARKVDFGWDEMQRWIDHLHSV